MQERRISNLQFLILLSHLPAPPRGVENWLPPPAFDAESGGKARRVANSSLRGRKIATGASEDAARTASYVVGLSRNQHIV